MPRRKEEFLNNEIYHIASRGIDDKTIFNDKDDYYRGVFSIYEFNNSKPVSIKHRRKIRARFKKSIRGRVSDGLEGEDFMEKDKRDKMVEVLTFCFMPNHFHLLLKQIQDNGISRFMKKVNGGYGRHFNEKYKRKGYVFQNRFHSVHVQSDDQLRTVFNYIHANPVSLIEPNFKELGIRNHSVGEIIKFLKKYKWSSFQDYIGVKNFPSVTGREFLLNMMGGEKGVIDNLSDWLYHKKELAKFRDLFLE